jgi:triacylglycerol lipase
MSQPLRTSIAATAAAAFG